MNDRFTADKAPDVGVEPTELFLDCQESFRVIDGGENFCRVADDSGVMKQGIDLPLAVSGHFLGIEIGESFSISLALAQHGVPAQPRLGRFQGKKLEDHAVVVDGHAPLFVVVVDVVLIVRRDPRAATVGADLSQHRNPSYYYPESFRSLRKFSRLRRGTFPLPERGLSPFGWRSAKVGNIAGIFTL